MAKVRTKFVCQQCGYETARYMGKCPECNSWDSFVEETTVKDTRVSNNLPLDNTPPPMLIKDVQIAAYKFSSYDNKNNCYNKDSNNSIKGENP